MKPRSIFVLALLLSLSWCGVAGGVDAPTTLASTWSKPGRFVTKIGLRQGSGRMQIGLSQSGGLKWTTETEPWISPEVEAGCKGSAGPLDIDLAGDPEQVAQMTDLAMEAFMTGMQVQVSIELVHCSAGGRYLVRGIRPL